MSQNLINNTFAKQLVDAMRENKWPAVCDMAYGFAACAHRNQVRKYTGEPYVNHCIAVALIVHKYGGDTASICAALLHDVVEDTDVEPQEIRKVFGNETANLVMEVTDIAIHGGRAWRKKLDREHFAKSSPRGATIKLADLINNTSSIVEYDKNFARVYLEEKALLLDVLKHGNPQLWELAYKTLQEAQAQLVQHALEKV